MNSAERKTDRPSKNTQSSKSHSSRVRLLILRLWPLLLPPLLLIPALTSFPYPDVDADYSDLVLTHYPYAVFLRNSIQQDGSFPTWSPGILSGAPFAANPLAGLWYPPGWFALFFPLPLGFNLSIILHLVWGGLGIYTLLRSETLSHKSAMFGTLSFEAMPKLFAHYGAGHLTLLYALPWTPWLLWAASSRLKIGKRNFTWGEALFMAVIFLADVRWAAYAVVLWWAYALTYRGRDGMGFKTAPYQNRILHLLKQTALAALLAAPLALPFLEYTRLSSRTHLSIEDVLNLSLPIERFLGLIFPDFGGFHEWTLYPGILVLAMSVLAILWSKSLPGARFWIWAAGLSLVFSLGSSIPLIPLIARLPLFNMLRVPSRALFITGLSLCMLAAYGVEKFFNVPSKSERTRGRLALTALTGFALTLAIGVLFISGEIALNFAWGAGGALIGLVWIGIRLGERVPEKQWYFILVFLCLLDLWIVDRSLYYPKDAKGVFSEARDLAEYLAESPGEFRIYSPSYSIPQQAAANYRLQLADGVDPLQLQSYVEFMQIATKVPWNGYSVTVPPFATGNPETDNADFEPDPAMLGLLNVGFVASEFDLEQEPLELVSKFGSTRLYRNKEAFPRAWIQRESADLGERVKPVELVYWSPEKIEIQGQGPGLVVLSEVDYPGWQVWVDGERADIEVAEGLLRAVWLESGTHQVVFVFRPGSVFLGLFLFLITVGLLILRLLFRRRKKSNLLR